MRRFRAVLSFLTVIPGGVHSVDLAAKGFSLAPLIGIVIAIPTFLALELYTFIGKLLAASIAVAIQLLLTGFLHIDGFADTVDGLASRRCGEEMLKIVKDPRRGSFAIAAVCLDIVLTLAAFYTLISLGREVLPILVAVYSWSYGSIAMHALSLPPEPYPGLGRAFSMAIRSRRSIAELLTILTAITIATSMLSFCVPIVVASMILATAVCSRVIRKRLGFATGDTMGFCYEMSKLVGLVVAASLSRALPFYIIWSR